MISDYDAMLTRFKYLPLFVWLMLYLLCEEFVVCLGSDMTEFALSNYKGATGINGNIRTSAARRKPLITK